MAAARLRLATIIILDQEAGVKGSLNRIRARYHPPAVLGITVVLQSGRSVGARFAPESRSYCPTWLGSEWGASTIFLLRRPAGVAVWV